MKTKRTVLLVVAVIAALLLTGVGLVAWRVRRVATVARQMQTALARGSSALATPAGKGLSPGFLRMAFGDNPALYQEVTRLVGDGSASGRDVAMILVTYRSDAPGNVREVAVRLFGGPSAGPATVPDGSAKLSQQVKELKESALGMLGHEMVLLAAPEERQRQRALMTAIAANRAQVIEEYLREPVQVAAAFPAVDWLVADAMRPAVLAVRAHAVISTNEASAAVVAVGYDARQARTLAQFLTDTRAMAVGVARIKFTEGPVDAVVRAAQNARIAPVGTCVVVNGQVPAHLIEVGMPRLVKLLSKYVTQIEVREQENR